MLPSLRRSNMQGVALEMIDELTGWGVSAADAG
jgi:hypothetical protein